MDPFHRLWWHISSYQHHKYSKLNNNKKNNTILDIFSLDEHENAKKKTNRLLCCILEQWFSNVSWRHPCPAHFVCKRCLIRETYKMCRAGMPPRTRLKTTVLEVSYFKHSQALHGYYHIRPLGFSRKLPCSLITVTETDVQPLTPRRCSELRSAVFLSLTPLLLAHTDFLIKHDEKCAAHSRLLQACFAICEDRPVSEGG